VAIDRPGQSDVMNYKAYAALVDDKEKQVSGPRVPCQIRLWPSETGLQWQLDRTVKLAAQEDVRSCSVRYFATPNGQAWLAEMTVGQVAAGQVVEVKPN
jgi:hypothetical protein